MKLNNFSDSQQIVGARYDEWLSQVIFRFARESDLRLIEWDGEYSEYRNVYADVFNRAKAGLALMWLAEYPGWEPIGQVFVQLKTNDQNTANGITRAYVHSFRVREAWRGRGLGKRLMNVAETDLLGRGFREVTLNVARDNEGALRLYQRLGYKIIKKIPGRWSYYDPNKVLKHAVEPGYRMMKQIDA